MLKSNITVQDVARNVRAEDEEIPQLELNLKMAVSFLSNYIRRDSLDSDEQETFDLAVLFTASDYYMNGAGGARNNGGSKYTGLNSTIDSLKAPSLAIGGNIDGDI